MRLWALLALTALPSPARAKEKAPNIVLVVVDAMRADRLSSYGNPRKTSPHLDALAREGALFEDATAQGNWTLPALASLMTSLYPAVHGADAYPSDHAGWGRRLESGQFAPERGGKLDASRPTLARQLNAAGYETYGFAIGGICRSAFGFNNGFEAYRDEGRRLHEYLPELADWLGKARTRPFFLYLHANDVHHPYDTLPRFNTLWDPDYTGALDGSQKTLDAVNNGLIAPSPRDKQHLIALYDGGISYTDDALGKLFARLRALGIWERTVVVVTADHGEEFGEHGPWQHGHSAYQPLVRVPLILKGPGLKAGLRVRAPVQSIDVAPTLLALAGAPALPGAQGRSLARLLRTGRDAAAPPPVFSEIFDIPSNGRKALVVRRGALKLIDREDSGPDSLYDLAADPGELRDVSLTRPADLRALRSLAEDWRDAAAKARARLPAPAENAPELDAATREKLQSSGYLPR